LQTKPALHDLMAAIGYLLLRWGWFERWRGEGETPSELDAVRRMRNALCHELEGAYSDPEKDIEPFVRCRTPEGVAATYSWSEIDAAIRELGRYRGIAPGSPPRPLRR
jgi:hypothetical protein